MVPRDPEAQVFVTENHPELRQTKLQPAAELLPATRELEQLGSGRRTQQRVPASEALQVTAALGSSSFHPGVSRDHAVGEGFLATCLALRSSSSCEVNILWAAHQVHHSSEDYNLFTALRQSVLQKYTSWIFNLPMALFIPPSVFAVHLQFNLLYQFWIHTEVISNLGPLEWILNTPSHHRVHHGRNPYCIDKNYGGTLIIWDRIFGTFEAEDAKVVYGLTHPVNSFDPIMLQLRPLAHIWNTFWATPGFCNKLSVIFKGPGWGPGKPRLGLPEEIPVITGKEVPFNPSLPAYLNCYAVVHFAVILDLYTELLGTVTTLSQGTLLLRIGFIILSLTSFGLLMENRPKAGILEIIRCLVFVGVYKLGYLRSQFSSLGYAYEVLFSLCAAFWGIQIMKRITSSKDKHH
ncbi:PREDICTED: alkylglycerol monooxygenase [Fulmarus glacialis]|uniref:alkylglycerol monooxygenase n=1 Tax=Fulmarus glacialis TaxID=30455 RepID=UPI00051C4F4D|nr:PREDICTED: alkylglycerol monooxygenase [Fulmarus glacialis]